jgi:hypothetical protein
MSHPSAGPLVEQFLSAADDVAQARPEVDLELPEGASAAYLVAASVLQI